MSNGGSTNLLLEKYKLLWDHYKLQHETSEKRRYFLWLVESALILALFNFIKEKPFAIAIIFMGMIISIIFFFVLRRDRESIFLTQEQLRDIEHQLNEINNEVIFNKFIIDTEIHNKQSNERGSYLFPYSGRLFNEEAINNYWLSCGNNESIKDDSELPKSYKILKKLYGCLEHNIRCLKNKLGYKIFSVKYLLDYITPILFIMAWVYFFIIYLFPHSLIVFSIWLLYIVIRNKCCNKLIQ